MAWYDDVMDGMKGMGNSFSSLTTGAAAYQSGISALVYIQDEFSKAVLNSVKNATWLEQRYSALNKTFGINSTQAANFGNKIEELSKDLGVGGKTALLYAQNLNKIGAGFLVTDKKITGFRQRLFEAQKMMITQLKVTEQAAEGFERYAAAVNKGDGQKQLETQLKFTKALESRTDMTGTMRDLTEELGNLTSDLQLQYSRIPGSLELGVLKARALGMTMAQLNSAGNSLLNIESSIGDELEYQLLTGERLVDESGKSLTNSYREAQLKGDANAQANIMNEILENQGDMLQNNLLARQSMAKMLGMDEASLAKAIQQKRIYDKLAAETNLGKQELMKMTPEELMKVAESTSVTAEDLKAMDNRTTDQQVLEQLESINTNIVTALTGKFPGGAGAIVSETQTTATSDALLGSMTRLGNVLGNQGAGLIGNLQSMAYVTDQLNTALSNLAENIPFFGGIVTFLKGSILGTLTGGATAMKGMASTGIVPETAQNINSNDALITFNPDDKFMMIAGTNVNGNADMASAVSNGSGMTDAQINTLAAAFATAVVNGMRGVTITTDPLYNSTSVNGSYWS